VLDIRLELLRRHVLESGLFALFGDEILMTWNAQVLRSALRVPVSV
jgi:hypothetical protein